MRRSGLRYERRGDLVVEHGASRLLVSVIIVGRVMIRLLPKGRVVVNVIVVVGCGCGGLGKALNERFGVVNYMGIDINEQSINQANDLHRNLSFAFLNCDVLDYKPVNLYDVVLYRMLYCIIAYHTISHHVIQHHASLYDTM